MQTAKGECGPKSMGQNGAETHLRTIRVPMDLHSNNNNLGNQGHWGNEPVILPRPAKPKGIHPSESGFQKQEKNLGNLRLWEWAKRSTECGPQLFYIAEKFKRDTPVIKINYPTYGIFNKVP